MSSISRAHSFSILLASSAALLGGCSGGGGGGGVAGEPPVIVAAAFVGPGATPTAGDILILTFSREVTLVDGAALDDADFTLSDGTLGAMSSGPTALSNRSLQLVLGNGANLTPGTTTIAFSGELDAIASVEGVMGGEGDPQTITKGDGNFPAVTSLTLDDIDDELNGLGPAGGTLQVPRTGFTIDLAYSDPTSPIDSARTVLLSSAAVTVDGVAFPAGKDLARALTLTFSTSASARYRVPSTVSFQDGAHTLTAVVIDSTGMGSVGTSFAFTVRNLDDFVRPFESPQLWYIDLSRDLESFGMNLAIFAGANGTPDLEDLLVTAGVLSTTPIPGVVGGQNSNQVVMGALREDLLAELALLYEEVDISFTFLSPGAFPDGFAAVPYSSLSFSQICIAGTANGTDSGILGTAQYNPNNSSQENNSLTDFASGTIRLGVFPHASFSLGFQTGPSSDFRQTYDPLRPSISGTPIGNEAGDDARLLEVLAGTNSGSDPRIDDMETAIRKTARLLAVVTAHECAHSMGLVANGPMPVGLYGNDPLNFPLSGGLDDGAADGHIQNLSLFTIPGSQNVMSPAISFHLAQSPETTFNTLNLAYLRERAIYVPN